MPRRNESDCRAASTSAAHCNANASPTPSRSASRRCGSLPFLPEVVVTTWLIDKSAIARLHTATNATEWADRIERGLVRICTVTRLEVGYSARSATDHRTLVWQSPLASMPVEYLTPKIEDRSLELQSILSERGQHRAPSIPDLLIAATAELAELTVLHLDKDFELVAQVTGQPLERLNID